MKIDKFEDVNVGILSFLLFTVASLNTSGFRSFQHTKGDTNKVTIAKPSIIQNRH